MQPFVPNLKCWQFQFLFLALLIVVTYLGGAKTAEHPPKQVSEILKGVYKTGTSAL